MDIKDMQRKNIELDDKYHRILDKSSQLQQLEERNLQTSNKVDNLSLKLSEKNTNLEEYKNKVRLLSMDNNDLKK
jgi:hypothetical protein